MSQQVYGRQHGGNAAENYEKYFVPSIASPVAADLMTAAGLRPGERVLDVACGTGVVTRLAAERVGSSGKVAGLDVNPAMLALARSLTPRGTRIDWYESTAEAMPLPDEAFDVVLCQMGLQFIPNKLAALREMRRVLAPGGRSLITLPGPTPAVFEAFAAALARHIDPAVASFVHMVFALHDDKALATMMSEAGFHDVEIRSQQKDLRLPPPADFLWQYVDSTPMAAAVAKAGAEKAAALERDLVDRWQQFVQGDGMALAVRMTTVVANQ